MENVILTHSNGAVVGEYKAENVIDLYYEHLIHGTAGKDNMDFMMDAILKGYLECNFKELDCFNNTHNTLETFTEAVLATAERCDCTEKAKEFLKQYE